MIPRDICLRVLQKAVSTGADYAEIFAENTVNHSINMIASKVDSIKDAVIAGAAVRVYKGLRSVMATTVDTSESGLLRCAEKAAEALGEGSAPMDIVLRDMRILLDTTVGVRRCGAAALDMCFVACGAFDAYFEGWIKPWDVAAGWLLVEEAGGRVSGRNGEPYEFNTPILVSNGLVHEEMIANLRLDEEGRPLRQFRS